MKFPFILFAIIIANQVDAQVVDFYNINGKKLEFYDYTNLFSSVYEDFNIGNGDARTNSTLFRLSHEGKIIELRSINGHDYRLVQYFFAWKCTNPPSRTGELFTDSIVYDSAFALSFYNKYVKDIIKNTMNEDGPIPFVNDGVGYSINFKDSNVFYQRFYNNGQYLEKTDSNKLSPAQKNILAIFNELNTQAEYTQFIKKKKLSCYNNGGYGIMAEFPEKKHRRRKK